MPKKKKDKKPAADDPDGPPIPDAARATLLRYGREAAEKSLETSAAALTDAADEARRLHDEGDALRAELSEVKDDMKDQYFFLQQKLDDYYDLINDLERRALVHAVE